MTAGDRRGAGVLARSVTGSVAKRELAVRAGDLATPMPRASTKNTGATTSTATARPRSVPLPLPTRRNDTIAGGIVTTHSSAPSSAVAGITASIAPTTTTTATAPRPLHGAGRCLAVIG